MSIKVAESLAVAKVFLQECGWTQGALEKHGRLCALGAIAAAKGIDIAEEQQADNLPLHREANALAREIKGWYCIPDWNDAESRTLEEVLEVFDRAIARELSR